MIPVTDENFLETCLYSLNPGVVFFHDVLQGCVNSVQIKEVVMTAAGRATIPFYDAPLQHCIESADRIQLCPVPCLVFVSDGMVQEMVEPYEWTPEDIRIWIQENT